MKVRKDKFFALIVSLIFSFTIALAKVKVKDVNLHSVPLRYRQVVFKQEVYLAGCPFEKNLYRLYQTLCRLAIPQLGNLPLLVAAV